MQSRASPPLPMSSRVTILLFWYVVPLSENQTSFAPGKEERYKLHNISVLKTCFIWEQTKGNSRLSGCAENRCCEGVGSWFFPNKTRVPSHGNRWDFFRTRGQMVVHINRKRGGVNGIYRCLIPDARNVTQTMYIGVCSAKTSEWSILF